MPYGVRNYLAHWGGSSTLLKIGYDILGTKYPCNHSLTQVRIEVALLRRCEQVGIGFAWDHTLVSIEQDAETVTATFQTHEKVGNEETTQKKISAPWLLGCDGTHSAVRKAVQIPWQGEQATRWCWFADCHVTEETPRFHFNMTPTDPADKAIVIALDPGRRVRVAGFYTPQEIAASRLEQDQDQEQRWHPSPPGKQFISDFAKRNWGTDWGMKDEIPWASVAGNSMFHAATYRAGRVFLVGDAAHQFFPAGGQGMNTGFIDGVNLAWKLAMVVGKKVTQPEAVERVLESYNGERRPCVEAVIRNVRAQMVIIFSGNDDQEALTDFIAEALKQPSFNALWARRMTGFDEPTQPYRRSLEADSGGFERHVGHGLVGTRLTHLGEAHEADLLQAAQQNVFLLAFLKGSSDEGGVKDGLVAGILSSPFSDQVKVLETEVEPKNDKWEGVRAILVRPDLRVAWVAPEGSEAESAKASLGTTLAWWLGEH